MTPREYSTCINCSQNTVIDGECSNCGFDATKIDIY